MFTEDQMLMIMFTCYAYMLGFITSIIYEHWDQIKYVRAEYKKNPEATKRKYGRNQKRNQNTTYKF